MSTCQNIDLYSVLITSKPVNWEIVHNALCFCFWFCLALVWLSAILITGLDVMLTINYPLALWFYAVQLLITWLLTVAWINVYDSAWSWSASGCSHQTLQGEVITIEYKRSIHNRLNLWKKGWVMVHHFVPNFVREFAVSSKEFKKKMLPSGKHASVPTFFECVRHQFLNLFIFNK